MEAYNNKGDALGELGKYEEAIKAYDDAIKLLLLLPFLQKEKGYQLVEGIIGNSAISAVNFSELVTVLVRSSLPEREIDEIITDIVPEIIPFSENIAIDTGKFANETKEHGLSLGDRACLATGQYYDMEIYTADKVWLKLQKHIKPKIIVLR